jgi:hypothetical protein
MKQVSSSITVNGEPASSISGVSLHDTARGDGDPLAPPGSHHMKAYVKMQKGLNVMKAANAFQKAGSTRSLRSAVLAAANSSRTEEAADAATARSQELSMSSAAAVVPEQAPLATSKQALSAPSGPTISSVRTQAQTAPANLLKLSPGADSAKDKSFYEDGPSLGRNTGPAVCDAVELHPDEIWF